MTKPGNGGGWRIRTIIIDDGELEEIEWLLAHQNVDGFLVVAIVLEDGLLAAAVMVVVGRSTDPLASVSGWLVLFTASFLWVWLSLLEDGLD